MASFWSIDETSPAAVQESQPGGAVAPAAGAGTGASFLTGIEQHLGDEAAPDAAFFVESWTVGVAAASENHLRRQKERKSRRKEMTRWETFSSFAPFFVARMEASANTTWPFRESRDEQGLTMDWQPRGALESDDWNSSDETEIVCPLTLQAARRVLNVTPTTTREQIRAAYRKMASHYHPDRLPGREAREQKLASDHMALINEAYRLLCGELVGRWSACWIR